MKPTDQHLRANIQGRLTACMTARSGRNVLVRTTDVLAGISCQPTTLFVKELRQSPPSDLVFQSPLFPNGAGTRGSWCDTARLA